MKLAIATAAFAAVLSLAAASDASAWTRTGSVTTRNGTYSRTVDGSCGGHSCSRSSTVTGPDGHSVSRSGSITRTGPYRYSYSRTTTGPRGNGVTRRGWFRRW